MHWGMCLRTGIPTNNDSGIQTSKEVNVNNDGDTCSPAPGWQRQGDQKGGLLLTSEARLRSEQVERVRATVPRVKKHKPHAVEDPETICTGLCKAAMTTSTRPLLKERVWIAVFRKPAT